MGSHPILEDLIDHVEQTYGVAYRSLQSSYELLHEAGGNVFLSPVKRPIRKRQSSPRR